MKYSHKTHTHTPHAEEKVEENKSPVDDNKLEQRFLQIHVFLCVFVCVCGIFS